MIHPDDLDRFRVRPGASVKLKDHDPGWEDGQAVRNLGQDGVKKAAQEALRKHLDELAAQQELLWASSIHSVLVVLQGMDASGKDGVIKHVMNGLNPQGSEVQ